MMLSLGKPDLAWRRRRTWQRDYSQMRSDVRGYGEDSELATGAGAGVSAGIASTGRTAQEAIFIGVTTGVLVWSITHALDKLFGGRK